MLYSPELPLRDPTFFLKTCKCTNFLSRISHWMTVWLGLHPTLDTSPTMVFGCLIINWLFVQIHFEIFHSHLCSSVSQYFLSFHKFNRSKILWPDALPGASRYDDGAQYFYGGTISRWFPTKAEERFACPWDKDCILPGTKLIF